jgi:hypothetical protein
VFYRIINSEPDLAELPAELRDLVLACLAKDPGDRPATPDLLRRLLGGGEVAASAERTPERMVARQAVAVGGEPVVTIKDVPGPVDLLPDAPPVNVETAARRPPPTKRPGPKNDRPVASLVLSALAVAGLITGVAILFGVNDGHGLGDLRAIGDKPHIVPGQSMCAQGGCAQGRSSLRYTLGADRSIATTFQIPGDKTRFFDTELDVIKPAAACGRSVTVRYHAYADYHTGAYDYRRLLDMGDVTRHRDVAEVPLGRATTLHFTAALTAPPPGCTVTLELSNPVIHSLRWMA